MSTNLYTVQELAASVVRIVASGACDYPTALKTIARMSWHNVRAVAENYHENTQFDALATADEIERYALPILAAPHTWLDSLRCGSNLGYNCAECPEFNQPTAEFDGRTPRETLKALEEHANNWFEQLENVARRKSENDRAYVEEPPLPTKSAQEIQELATAGGFSRVIIAEFSVNESDSQSDYYGGRTVRRVVIGFGKGKRENFRELRQAAGCFPPSLHLACDRVSVFATVHTEPDKWNQRRVYWKDEQGDTIHFRTMDEAKSAVIDLQTSHPQCQADYVGCIDFPGYISEHSLPTFLPEYQIDSPEHRENYSMGGGNYLGWNRYGGWSVFSESTEYFRSTETIEFFEAPKKIVGGKVVKPAPLPGRQKPAGEPKATFPQWTEKGQWLQKTGYDIHWPHNYNKEQTAANDVAKLAKMGVNAEIVPLLHGYGRKRVYRVRLIAAETIEAASQDTVAPQSEPDRIPFDLLAVL